MSITTNHTRMLAKVINCLNFDWKTKPELINRITQTEIVEVFDEAGQATQREVTFFISTESMEKFCTLLKNKCDLPDVISND